MVFLKLIDPTNHISLIARRGQRRESAAVCVSVPMPVSGGTADLWEEGLSGIVKSIRTSAAHTHIHTRTHRLSHTHIDTPTDSTIIQIY